MNQKHQLFYKTTPSIKAFLLSSGRSNLATFKLFILSSSTFSISKRGGKLLAKLCFELRI